MTPAAIRARLDEIWAMPNDRHTRVYSALRAVLGLCVESHQSAVTTAEIVFNDGQNALRADILRAVAEHLGVSP